jgi:class 3 adenylate cyclase
VAICSSCGQENPAGARFCNSCAHPLADGTAEAREERKIVTVLFADLEGFTARAERLDPEDVRAILHRYHACLRAEIEAFGGIVEKFIGDAVMAVFGAPVAHGDDPERGVRAAFAVRTAIADLNAADHRLDLQVRIAVNTGEAFVSLGAKAELGEGMVAGDVVNTASRLQTAAPTGGILVGEETFRATRAVVDYREVEPLVAKGKSLPVLGWLAIGARTGPGERISYAVPMVGRVHEWAVLRRIFDGVVSERKPNFVTVIGESGIGKTRLASEFTASVESEGTRILRGRSLPYGAVTLYGPFSQHVKQFSGIFASDDMSSGREKLRKAVADIVVPDAADEVESHLALLTALGSEGQVADRQILFFAARRFAESLARNQPTVLVFEDIHWADDGTLDLLEVLASRVRDVPLMLLALARPELLHARPGWGGGLPAYTALSLEPLSTDESKELAGRLLGADADASGTVRVVETAEGNPLFIEELAASVVERPAAVADTLPTTIRELVSARLDALPSGELPVLLDAAVVGKVFWRGVLEQMAGNGTNVEAALDALEARNLIRRESYSWIEREEQFSFKHVMIRDVAYATVPRAKRKERHAVVAGFLEKATAGAGATATALAQHWREAGNDLLALEYLVLAADQAGRGWAKDEAATLYRQALELIPEQDTERRRDISRKLALAIQAAFHIADVRRAAERSDPGASG